MIPNRLQYKIACRSKSLPLKFITSSMSCRNSSATVLTGAPSLSPLWTARMSRIIRLYARLLDVALAAGAEDANGIIFARCPIAELAGALGRSAMTVKRALRELEDAGLLLRVRQGFGEPNKIYVLIPRQTQKQDCGQAAEPV